MTGVAENGRGEVDRTQFVSCFRPLCYPLMAVQLLVAFCGPGMAAEFITLDPPPNVAFTVGRGVSDDGTVVAITMDGGPGQWTIQSGLVHPFLPDPEDSGYVGGVTGDGSGVSGDGTTVFGSAQLSGERRSAPTVFVGPLAGETIAGGSGTIQAASFDGSIMVGQFALPGEQNQAFRWDGESGFEFLELPGGYGRATDISADGSVIVGSSEGKAIRWDEQGVRELGINNATVVMVSDDASHIAVSGNGSVIQAQSDLSIVPLRLNDDPLTRVHARGINRNGSIVVGWYRMSNGASRGFVWTPERGGEDLQSLLVEEFGMDFGGWILRAPQDISANGRFIAGSGIGPNGEDIGWLIRFGTPHCCHDRGRRRFQWQRRTGCGGPGPIGRRTAEWAERRTF